LLIISRFILSLLIVMGLKINPLTPPKFVKIILCEKYETRNKSYTYIKRPAECGGM
jgi:hypothetical protein